MAYLISLLRDDFTDNVISPAWDGVAVGSATAAETGGQARFTLPSSTAGSHDARYTSTAAYDITGDGCFITIGTMVATGVAATAYFVLEDSADATNALKWVQTSGTLKAQKTVAGVTTDLFSVTWNATTYKYLKIRESAGDVLFDSSSTGLSWTNRYTGAAPFAVTALRVVIGAACGNIASPGSFRLDEFNIVLPVSSATWRHTTADWGIFNRFRPVTLAATANAEGVLVTADTMDASEVLGGTLRYFAGPVGSSSGGYLALTEYASLALAQASAFPVPVNERLDLPVMVDARYMRLYHRSTDASGHAIREFVPRRIVQADDIEAEEIRTIHLGAGVVTADKIFVLELSAITAFMGSLTMNGPIDITTGSLIGGGGVVTLDAGGLGIINDTVAEWTTGGYKLLRSTGLNYGVVNGTAGNFGAIMTIGVWNASTQTFAASVAMQYDSSGSGLPTSNYRIGLNATGGTDVSNDLRVAGNLSVAIDLTASGNVDVADGINVGTATGAGTGQISTSGSVGIGVSAQSNIRLITKGQDATSSNYGFFVQNSAAATTFYVRNDGAGFLLASAFTYGSDRRWKRNIVPLNRGLAAIKALNPVRFDYLDGRLDELGFLADEVQIVMPELVEVVTDDGYLGLKTTSIIPVLVSAFKTLIARVEALEGRS